MADTYTLHIAGLTRELPICKVNDHLDIAAFIMFSDVELTEACAAALLAGFWVKEERWRRVLKALGAVLLAAGVLYGALVGLLLGGVD